MTGDSEVWQNIVVVVGVMANILMKTSNSKNLFSSTLPVSLSLCKQTDADSSVTHRLVGLTVAHFLNEDGKLFKLPPQAGFIQSST